MTNTVNVDDKNIATVEITVDANVARDLYERTLKSYAASRSCRQIIPFGISKSN